MKDEVFVDLEHEKLEIRVIRQDDLEAVIKLDEANTGFRRESYLTLKFQDCLTKSGIVVSLVAVSKGMVVGFIMGDLYYGAFGRTENSVTITSLAIEPELAGQKIGSGLLEQFMQNVKALKVQYIDTLVDWDQNFDLLGFFRASGFNPGRRIHLYVELDS
ncbi:MAG: GNAT family N-acetyltransferase [Deltaproteobacteria bacterium]|nr:GNAT family N-acetyltransferase [Deltaproteobacteria bacterium]